MSIPISSSAALPIACVVLRTLIVVNWLVGVRILALLVIMPNEQWIMAAFKLSPSPEAERLVMGLQTPSYQAIDHHVFRPRLRHHASPT